MFGQGTTLCGEDGWKAPAPYQDDQVVMMGNGCQLDPSWENDEEQLIWFERFILFGSACSLICLIPSIIIFLSCRSLRCTRNYIHANLMISFALTSICNMLFYPLSDYLWDKELDYSVFIKNMPR